MEDPGTPHRLVVDHDQPLGSEGGHGLVEVSDVGDRSGHEHVRATVSEHGERFENRGGVGGEVGEPLPHGGDEVARCR